ncbi:isoprenyl transferase [Deinococcus deserti]|uniref:Isoprenyl transferase n=1 Tax=Deinococcus deserti (strain DSM 17065 / CIP 109153 / LMG 22923 / VCD115) TaxID=546414 RepID=C1CYI5_DEIDV|nr:isoprenyl transferase [Deinococcus deserti]ACO45006.1 putative Undecaprenyl pyrophosphate synthetase (UPP synthetase) (Di-trans,poly-cis-decaprenylcistransferase) (Undecaprenyl diphosphate synthase) (UDS) [Deinococcus deserti VCD115]
MSGTPVKAAVRTLQKTRSAARGALMWGYEQRLTRAVKGHGKLPRHLGLILDGNRRFARAAGLQREMGHSFGAEKAHEVLQWCLELGIPAATIWVLSTDNTSRDPQELAHILALLEKEARNLATDPRIHANRVRVRAIGQHANFPSHVLTALRELEERTAHYDGMRLNIAVGYGGREEIVDAVKTHLQMQAAAGRDLSEVAACLRPDDISAHLYAADIPDPDFIIRTSGEIRLSGFMLWQSVYSEYYFCDVYWPGFRRVDFLRALRDFQGRDRRFGK